MVSWRKHLITAIIGTLLCLSRIDEAKPSGSVPGQSHTNYDENSELKASPLPSDWGKTVDGIRCRVLVCKVSRDPDVAGALELAIKLDIQNTTSTRKKIALYYESKPKDGVPGFILDHHVTVQMPYPTGRDWGGVGDRLMAPGLESEIVISSESSTTIQFSFRIPPQTSTRILEGTSLRVAVGGHQVQGANWTGPAVSGEFGIKRNSSQGKP